MIYSSSATVYGHNSNNNEDATLIPVNPYGSTKVCIEFMLKDLCQANNIASFISLRYYNPCKLLLKFYKFLNFYHFYKKIGGAHPSGLIGDQPTSFPNNLFPVIEEVITCKR